MIQDIAPHQYHNSYQPRHPQSQDIVFGYEGRTVLAKKDEAFFKVGELPLHTVYQYLFTIDDTAFFLADLSNLPTFAYDIRTLRTYQPQELAFAAITGWQLYRWYSDHKYCGACGAVMQPSQSERALVCPDCGAIVYPTIQPAVIVAVIHEGKILVTKYAHAAYQDYALIAGFTEIGETIEETVQREVKEEVGLEVCDITFYRSQPWSFSSTLLFGFWCHVKGSTEIQMDDGELRLAQWRGYQEEINHSDASSLTHEMIDQFLQRKDFFHGQ